MNCVSVINSQNLQATREAQVAELKERGFVVAVQQHSGLVSIGDIKVYTSVREARAALSNIEGDWAIV